MKKVLVVVVLVLSLKISFGQISYGIQVDGIVSFQRSKTNPARSGGLLFEKGGVFSYIPVGSKLSLMPQMNLLMKGAFWSYLTNSAYYQNRERLTYLEMPIYILYKDNKHSMEGFFGGLGPVISYGLGGNVNGFEIHSSSGSTYPNYSGYVRFDGKEDATDGQRHYTPFEVGASVIAGYQCANGLFINLHYYYGLTGTHPNHPFYESKNSYFGGGIGYTFLHK